MRYYRRRTTAGSGIKVVQGDQKILHRKELTGRRGRRGRGGKRSEGKGWEGKGKGREGRETEGRGSERKRSQQHPKHTPSSQSSSVSCVFRPIFGLFSGYL